MSKYRTCYNCAVNPTECPTRVNLTRALAGLNVTSVKHRCPDRQQLFKAGQRVSVTWVITGDDGYYGNASEETWPASEETWPATVILEKGSKFVICVDDVDSDEGTPAKAWLKNETRYAKVTANKLKPLDEPARNVCALCGIIEDNGFNGCWQQGTVPHLQCLRAMTATHPQSPACGGMGER